MQLLTKESDYAIRALICIASSSGRASTAATIAREEDISWMFLRRLLQRLAVVGILTSQKGRSGGFSLSRPPDKITLVDVITAFQGRIELSECLVRGKPCCRRRTCPVRRRLRALERTLRSELAKIDIAMLADVREREVGSQRTEGSPAEVECDEAIHPNA